MSLTHIEIDPELQERVNTTIDSYINRKVTPNLNNSIYLVQDTLHDYKVLNITHFFAAFKKKLSTYEINSNGEQFSFPNEDARNAAKFFADATIAVLWWFSSLVISIIMDAIPGLGAVISDIASELGNSLIEQAINSINSAIDAIPIGQSDSICKDHKNICVDI